MANNTKSTCDVLVIGGGFYGTYISEHFAKMGKNVILCEKEEDLMLRASFSNQARVHNGYHYPRSVLTALKSRISFPRFNEEFKECIDDSFDKYYLIGKSLSKITASQFQGFCKRIGAPCEPAPKSIKDLSNQKLVEDTFKTIEYAFDAVKLRKVMLARLQNVGVEIALSTTVESIKNSGNGLLVTLQTMAGESFNTNAKQVFNCTYSMTNAITSKSGLDIIPLQHEMTEICLVKVPDELKGIGITVMCGPFFSTMPFPSTDLHTFSHVRYTPHYDWLDKPGTNFFDGHKHHAINKHHSAWRKMKQDAVRYIPILSECEYKSSLWEIKTILPLSEVDDSRPILFKQNYGLKGFHCVMGGKIDNIYDVIDVISAKGLDR